MSLGKLRRGWRHLVLILVLLSAHLNKFSGLHYAFFLNNFFGMYNQRTNLAMFQLPSSIRIGLGALLNPFNGYMLFSKYMPFVGHMAFVEQPTFEYDQYQYLNIDN